MAYSIRPVSWIWESFNSDKCIAKITSLQPKSSALVHGILIAPLGTQIHLFTIRNLSRQLNPNHA